MRRRQVLDAIFAGTATAAIILVGLEVLRGPRSVFGRFSRRMHAKYESIRIGTPKADVIAALGQPKRIEWSFYLPQRHGYEKLFEDAERSASIEFYLWKNGINWYYCIGLDRNGTVTIKGEGCS